MTDVRSRSGSSRARHARSFVTRCAAVDSLPLVAAGLIDFDLVPLKPYPGFARLFREG